MVDGQGALRLVHANVRTLEALAQLQTQQLSLGLLLLCSATVRRRHTSIHSFPVLCY